MPEALIRVKETRPMRGLSPEERADNVSGCFEVSDYAEEDLKGKRILLIDDFYTTGATAMECRKVLEKSGLSGIGFMAFAAK